MRFMTVGALKRHLEGITDDDAILVVPGFDHSYRSVDLPGVVEAELVGFSHLIEYHGEEHRHSKDSKIVKVLVLE